MSDRLPNAYPNFANNFPQGLSSQQAQHRPPQQLSSLSTQPTLTGIRKPEDVRAWQQQMQQQRQQQQQAQQHQQQQLQQQQQHSGGESIHVTTPQQQQQVCLAITSQSPSLPLYPPEVA
jgi:transcription initiation factor TFIID subunit TAF12